MLFLVKTFSKIIFNEKCFNHDHWLWSARNSSEVLKVYLRFCCLMVLAMFMNLIYLGPCRPMCVRVKQLCYPVLQEFNIPWPEALGKHQGCQFSLIIPSPFFINNVFHEKLCNMYVCAEQLFFLRIFYPVNWGNLWNPGVK